MYAKILLSALALFFVSYNVSAQALTTENSLLTYKAAETNMVLLKNEDGLIPLRKLESLRIVYLGDNQSEACVGLLKYLRKYTQIKEWRPELEKGGLPKADLLIVGIDARLQNPDAWALLRAQNVPSDMKKIGVWLGAAASLKRAGEQPTLEGLVLAPGEEPFASSLAAQAIFGAIGIEGRLSEAVSEKYPVGYGLETDSIQRLGYALPAVVGMDGQLMADSIKAIVEEGLAAEAYPGAQVLVAKDGKIIYHQTFGTHTYKGEKRVKTTDLYDYASVTKVTGALPAVMQLYGEGKFDLEAPLDRYVPEMANSNKGDLSYRSILAHNARLRAWIPYWQGTLKGNGRYPWKKRWDTNRINDYRFRARTFKRDSSNRYPTKIADDLWLHSDFKKRIYKAIRKSPLNENPGYVYSGLLFYLLPDIVSNLTNSDFETYLKRNIYYRLGAYTITYNPSLQFPKSRIVPTERDTFFSMMQIHGRVHDEGAAMMGGVSSNAGLFSTANDLAKLFQMYMNKGYYGGEQIIASKALEEFTRCQYCEEDNRRGLGFDKPLIEYSEAASSVAKDASPTSFGHSGYTGTFVWADPEHDLLFIFFSNRVHPTRMNRKLYQLGIRPRIHQALYDAMF